MLFYLLFDDYTCVTAAHKKRRLQLKNKSFFRKAMISTNHRLVQVQEKTECSSQPLSLNPRACDCGGRKLLSAGRQESTSLPCVAKFIGKRLILAAVNTESKQIILQCRVVVY